MDVTVVKAYQLLLQGQFLDAQKLIEAIDPAELQPPQATLRELVLAPDSKAVEIGLDLVEKLHAQDKVEEAAELINYLISRSPAALAYPRLNELFEQNAEISRIMHEYNDTTGWSSESSGTIRVSYKRIEGTPTISVKTEGVLNVPIFNLLALIYEIDLYNTWMPFCSEARVIASLSHTRRVVYQKFNMPVISDRECVLYGYGVNLIKSRNCIFVTGRSCDDEPTFKGVSLPKVNGVRSKVNFFGACFRPIDRDFVEMKLISNMDPKLSLLPYSVFNYLLRKFASKVFNKIADNARNLNPQLRQRVREGSEFYSYLQSSLDEFYSRD